MREWNEEGKKSWKANQTKFREMEERRKYFEDKEIK